MRVPLALAAVLLLLAGCSDPSPAPPGPAGGLDASTSSSAPPTPSGPMPAAVAVPVHWTGHTKEGAWVCPDPTGDGHCLAGQQVQPDGEFATMVAYEGGLTGIDLTLSWSPDPTQAAGLALAVLGNTSAGFAQVAFASGPSSPLTLQFDAAGLGLAPGDAIMLMVWPQGKTPTQPSVFVDATQQAFQVDGTLSSVKQA